MRCLVVDIDDTLYLERDYVRSGFAAVDLRLRHTHERTGFLDAAWSAFLDGHRADIFDRALAAIGIAPSPALVRPLVACYRQHRPAIAMLTDAKSALDRAKTTYRIAVVSDGPLESQRAKVEALTLGEWADPIVLTEEHGPNFRKPSERAFAQLEHVFAARGHECCYVADNPLKDFGGPKARGWHTIRVRRVDGLHADRPSGSDVDCELPSLDGLGALLRELD